MTENEAKKIITRFCEDRMNFARGKDMSDKELEDFCKFSEALNISISALEEIQQYRSIGTVEECCAAEKQRAIKPTFEMNYGDFESLFACECGKKIVVRHNRGVMDNHDGPCYCSKCGKKLDWGDTP